MYDDDGTIIGAIASFEDITERKRAEEALSKSEDFYRTLIENTEDGFVLTEPIFNETGESDDYHHVRISMAAAVAQFMSPTSIATDVFKERLGLFVDAEWAVRMSTE